MKRKIRGILSMLLVVALLIQLVPTTIFATENETAMELTATDDAMSPGYSNEFESIENAASPATILFEEESLREENVKHFRMDDGSYIAVQYGTPVHYEENGEWVDYDNTLHEVSTLDGDGVSHYTVTNGDSTRVFAADASAEALLIVQKGDYSLSLTPVEESGAEIPLVPSEPVEAELMGGTIPADTTGNIVSGTPGITTDIFMEEIAPATILSVASDGGETFDDPVLTDAQPDKIYSALEYADVINGADIRYENYANTIKESIIISESQGEYVYSFCMETEGLTPSLQEDGSIFLISTDGNVPYRIPAPYMFDSNDQYSFDAYYTLAPNEDEWILTVTADAEWINAKERVFPVFLDPTVEETYTSESQICGGFVQKGYPGAPDHTNPDFYVGHSGNANGLIRTYLHVNELVELPEGCEIYEATISLYHVLHAYRIQNADIEVGVYEVTKAGSLDGSATASQWQNWADNLTWNQTTNGTTTIDSVILDKQTLGSSTAGGYVSWDITTLAFKWYDSENYHANKGIALRVITDDDESTVGSRAAFRGAGNNNYTSGKPCMKISYRNTRGIEDKYTYQTLDIGRAGTSYISDYTLDNTHIVPLFSSSSNVMPFSVSLVYNTSLTGSYFSSKYYDSNGQATVSTNHNINTLDYSNMLVGIGWKLSLQQTVKSLTVGGTTYLVYTDGDGTEHYFYNTGNGYQDEDGLSLNITISGTNYTMTNPYGDKWIFVNGYLTEQTDAYGNALYYCYNNNAYSSNSTTWKPTATVANKVTAVYRKIIDVSAAEQLLKIEYNGNFVAKIIGECDYSSSSAVAKRTVMLGMTDWSAGSMPYKMLTSLTLPDGTEMQYSYYPTSAKYNMRHRLYTVYDSEANYGIEFNYSYEKNVCRFFEYILDNDSLVYGAKYHAYKRAHSQTAYRYYGKDGLPYMDSDGHLTDNGTTDDLLTIKILDNEGRTVGSYTSNSDESEILGAGAATYTENSGTSKKNNRITSSASAGQQGINILQNGSAENGAYKWINANPTTDEHYIGNKSFLLGEIGLLQTVLLEKDETYTFSAYIKIPAGTTFSTNGGVWLTFLPVGSSDPLSSGEKINYSTDGIDKGWVRLTATYTPDADISCRVTVMRYGLTAGNVYADCLQLEKGEAASTYNIIDNGSFEHSTPNVSIPGSASYGWTSNQYAEVTTATKFFGNQAVCLEGKQAQIRLNQTVRLNLPGNTGFILTAWAKANAKPDSATAITETDKPFFSMLIRLYYSDGTSEPFFFPFDPYYNNWQYKQGIIEAKRGKDVTITHAIVVAAYDNNLNSVFFDNFSLRVEPVYSYNYNDNGDPVSATGTDTGTQTGEYTGVDLTKQTAPNGNVTNYTYNNHHDVLTSNIKGVATTYTYSNAGNIENTKITATGTSKYIEKSNGLSDDGNYTDEVYDDVGNKTSYNYHDYYGYLNTITNSKGIATQYRYTDSNGRLQQAYISDVTSIQYTYDHGQIIKQRSKAYANGTSELYQDYNFTYNDWNQNTSIFVGNRNLISYEYEDINSLADGGGNLEKMTYANGNSISYEYDKFDRPVKIVYNDTGEIVNYYYSADGTLSKVSYQNGSTSSMNYLFEYDSNGRMVRSTQLDTTKLYQRTEHLYDEFDRLYIQRWTIDGKTRSEKYTFDDGATGDGLMTQFKTGTGQRINYTYDALRRLSNASVANSEGQELFKTAYAYKTVSGSRTSIQVQYRNVRTTEGDPITGYKYEYDALGNIVEIRQSEGSRYLLYKYEYDTQNQLVKEVHYDGTGDGASAITATYTYTYDTAGNILSETKTAGTANSCKTYSYEDGQWRDLLTEVDGVSLTYDQSGNPLTYYNGTNTYTNITWEHGRQLASITTDGETYHYTYDPDGIRTQKVVDGVTHTYYTLNGKVMRESFPYNGNTIIMDFCYDELGRPFSVAYSKNGGESYTTYFYATNAQGDVEGLFRVIKNTESGEYEQKWYGKYIYDAWGNVTVTNASDGTPSATSLAVRNPLRYRGYYYDSETGFYYLRSRYYDPANHRFINADVPEVATTELDSFLQYNLFAYCLNNPVNMTDDSGSWPGWAKKLVAAVAIVAVVAVAAAVVTATGGAAAAGVACVLTGAAKGAAIGLVTGAIEGAASGAISHRVTTGSWSGAGQAALEGMADGALEGAITGAISGGMNSNYCFIAGTVVLTVAGHAAIETIQAGDLVWATDPDTNRTEIKQVVQTFINETTELVHISVNDEVISCTPEHPFYCPTKGWTVACKLRAGDILVTVNGEYVVVEKIQHELLEHPIFVYNFEVEDFHTYYVTSKNVLVHNNCVVKENGVRIESYYPNDHGNPAHLHVYGGGGAPTKIGPQGLPVKGYPSLSSQQASVVANNLKKIKKAIKEAQKYLRSLG